MAKRRTTPSNPRLFCNPEWFPNAHMKGWEKWDHGPHLDDPLPFMRG
jgi:hypothetical protein